MFKLKRQGNMIMTKIPLRLLLKQHVNDSGAVWVTDMVENGYRFKTQSNTSLLIQQITWIFIVSTLSDLKTCNH